MMYFLRGCSRLIPIASGLNRINSAATTLLGRRWVAELRQSHKITGGGGGGWKPSHYRPSSGVQVCSPTLISCPLFISRRKWIPLLSGWNSRITGRYSRWNQLLPETVYVKVQTPHPPHSMSQWTEINTVGGGVWGGGRSVGAALIVAAFSRLITLSTNNNCLSAETLKPFPQVYHVSQRGRETRLLQHLSAI